MSCVQTEIKTAELYSKHPMDDIMNKMIEAAHKQRKQRRPYRKWLRFDRKDPKTWPKGFGMYRCKFKLHSREFDAAWIEPATPDGEPVWMTEPDGDGFAVTEDPFCWTERDNFDGE